VPSLVAAACLATAMSVAVTGAARAAPASLAAPGDAAVSMDISGPAIGQVGQHFIGLSVESGALLTRAPQFDDTGNLARLLANLGGCWLAQPASSAGWQCREPALLTRCPTMEG